MASLAILLMVGNPLLPPVIRDVTLQEIATLFLTQTT